MLYNYVYYCDTYDTYQAEELQYVLPLRGEENEQLQGGWEYGSIVVW
jgi:hypothetical protein